MMTIDQCKALAVTRAFGLLVVLCAAGCTGLKDGSDTASPHDSQDAAIDAMGGDGDRNGDGGEGDASNSDPCEGHEDGTTFCVGDSIRSCPGALDEPCAGDDQCVDHDGEALCVCAIGAAASTDCEPAQECGADHGGCDSVTACALIGGEPACGACPSGFLGNGFAGCVATVIGIGIEKSRAKPRSRSTARASMSASLGPPRY